MRQVGLTPTVDFDLLEQDDEDSPQATAMLIWLFKRSLCQDYRDLPTPP